MIRQASTLLPLRDTPAGLQVLMIRRSPELFGGGWWVFPGGSVDEVDRGKLATKLITGVDDASRPWISAAIRETAEEVNLFLTDQPVDAHPLRHLEGEELYTTLVEAGATIDGSAIGYVSNWVTPERVKKRFDTRFFVAVVRDHDPVIPDKNEVDAFEWVEPAEMAARPPDQYPIIFPTRKHLELLARFDTATDALDHAASTEVVAIQPQIARGPDGERLLVIPGDEGYRDVVADQVELA